MGWAGEKVEQVKEKERKGRGILALLLWRGGGMMVGDE